MVEHVSSPALSNTRKREGPQVIDLGPFVLYAIRDSNPEPAD